MSPQWNCGKTSCKAKIELVAELKKLQVKLEISLQWGHNEALREAKDKLEVNLNNFDL